MHKNKQINIHGFFAFKNQNIILIYIFTFLNRVYGDFNYGIKYFE